jgi:hypothetical protein
MNESFAIITTCLDEDGFTYFVADFATLEEAQATFDTIKPSEPKRVAVQHELCRIRVLSTKGSIKL